MDKNNFIFYNFQSSSLCVILRVLCVPQKFGARRTIGTRRTQSISNLL